MPLTPFPRPRTERELSALGTPFFVQQLTEDKLPQEVCMLLDNLVGDTAKVAVLLMMEQHLGHVTREIILMHYLLK